MSKAPPIEPMFEFKVKNKNRQVLRRGSGHARTGIFYTPHGIIKTPNLAIVATHGKIKILNKADHKKANPDLTISNTFHLEVNNKVKEIKRAGGLHKWSGIKNPIMTDSGGFQVFSLGWGRVHKIGKVGKIEKLKKSKNFQSEVKITEEGAGFKYNNKKYKFTPESSIKIQKDLGADIIFVFDECTSPFHSYSYNKKSLALTHRWANRSLKEAEKGRAWKKGKDFALFGIVQGGVFKDLRKKSSKFIGALPFEGFGIGGSFGEKQMKEVLGWALEFLPEEKPRHLLGIGKIKDIFIAVKQGIDLFDCVVPTREARHGVLYTRNGRLAIEKEIFSRDNKVIEKNCGCFACKCGIKRSEVRHYFKTRKELGQRLATLHNIYFFKRLFSDIREAISKNKLGKLEKFYYNYK